MNNEKIIQLVTKAQNGDKNALNDLVNECYSDIYYYILKTVKNPDTAADATQETFMEIMTTLSKLREPAAFAVWARRVAYHQCTRYFRESKEVLLEENEDGETLLDVLPDESEDALPEQVVEDKELRRIVMAMIDNLPAEQRAAMLLYYYEKMSVKQIAEIQNTTEGTVKSRLNYARKAVRLEVEKYEEENETKLRGIIIIPFFIRFVFKKDRDSRPNVAIPDFSNMAAAGAASGAVSGVAANSNKAKSADETISSSNAKSEKIKAAGIGGAKKVVVAVLAGLVLAGGIGAGIFFALNGRDQNDESSSAGEIELPAWTESSVDEDLQDENELPEESLDDSEISDESQTEDENSVEDSSVEDSSSEDSSEPEHVHETVSGWKNDAEQHWQVCECGETLDGAPHSFSGAKCSVCGYMKATANLSFEESGNGYIVVYAENLTENDTDIVIPSEYNGKPVVGIGVSAFQGMEMIKSVYIPDTVTSIGNAAFMGCSSLTQINLPNSITKIDESAFGLCSSLKSVVLPQNLTEVKSGLFQSCSSLESVTISKNTKVGKYVFDFCTSLKNINFGGTVAEWEAMNVFDEFSALGGECKITCSDGEIVFTPEEIIY